MGYHAIGSDGMQRIIWEGLFCCEVLQPPPLWGLVEDGSGFSFTVGRLS